MKSCRVVDYSYRKNPLNLGIVSTQNGQVVAIVDFQYNVLHMEHENERRQLLRERWL